MTTMNPLPPQAYTKDIFLNAYAWVQNQPASIKEIATTPDVLVSLYLKATRDGASALERPSIQNFKNELKSLAGMMGEFDKASFAPPPTNEGKSPPRDTLHFANTSANPILASQPTFNQTMVDYIPPQEKSKVSYSTKEELDPLSCKMLEETRELFNLSTREEALRMLIKIGFSKAKEWLK